jgi:GH35 family endo-1,4-beta-xylanase
MNASNTINRKIIIKSKHKQVCNYDTKIALPYRVVDFVDKIIAKYQHRTNDKYAIQKAAEHIMLAYVIAEKCITNQSVMVNDYSQQIVLIESYRIYKRKLKYTSTYTH